MTQWDKSWRGTFKKNYRSIYYKFLKTTNHKNHTHHMVSIKKCIHFHQQQSQNHTSATIGLLSYTYAFGGGAYANTPARIWTVWNERWQIESNMEDRHTESWERCKTFWKRWMQDCLCRFDPRLFLRREVFCFRELMGVKLL